MTHTALDTPSNRAPCRSLPKEAGIRLKEDGITELKMHAPLLVGLLLHPFRPLVTVADPRGFVRSYNYHHPPHAHSDHHPVANEFHVLNGAPSFALCNVRCCLHRERRECFEGMFKEVEINALEMSAIC